jgi:hypothetical protein
VHEAGEDGALAIVLEDDGGSGRARNGQHSRRVDHPLAEAQVWIVVVALAVVVVQVEMSQGCLRAGQPVLETAADARVADVEDEAEALEVEVAGAREVGLPGAGHVLDDDRDAALGLHLEERFERALERRDDGRVARRGIGVPVGVDDVEPRADLGAGLEVAAVLVERLQPSLL